MPKLEEFNPRNADQTELLNFLRNAGVDVDATKVSPMRIRVRAIQKKRRLMIENGENPDRTSQAMTVTGLKHMILTMNETCYGVKTFVTIKALLKGISGEITVRRHQEAGGCRHLIKKGMCCECKIVTTGVAAFAMRLLLVAFDDPNDTYEMGAFNALANTFFGMDSVEEVRKMSTATQLDKLEEWSEIPVRIEAIMEYDASQCKVRLMPYKIAQLSLDYLTNFDAM